MSLPLASEFPAVTQADWQAAAEAALKGKDLSSLVTRTIDDIEIAPVFEAKADALRVFRQARQPGEGAWGIVQRCDVPDIAQANDQALADLKGGASGLALVLPGAITAGDHGVPVASRANLERVLRDVELDLISLRLDGGRLARVVAPWLLDEYRARNLDVSRCDLNLGLDPAAALAQTGFLVKRETLVERMSAMLALSGNAGHAGPLFIADARIYQEAGASPAQTIGTVAATLVETLRLLQAAGQDPVDLGNRVAIVCSVDADQFGAACLVRALRLVWLRICEVLSIEAAPIRIDVETSLRMMSRRDPYVNMLRTTSAAFGAGIGGADSIVVLPLSTTLGVPDGFARRMARNIQHILMAESGLGRVADPAAGSGYVEHLTCELARQGWQQFQQIEQQGGIFEALAGGHLQSQIANMAATTQQLVAKRKQKLTGLSEFANLERPRVNVWDIALPKDWSNTVEELAPSRDPASDVTCQVLHARSLGHDYERLRDAADRHAASASGSAPGVALVKLGPAAEHSVRATWLANLLAAGGIAAVGIDAGQDIDGLGEDFAASGCGLAVLCGSDERYADIAASVAGVLQQASAEKIWLAGKPGKQADDLRTSGIGGYIHDGADVVSILRQFHALLGIEQSEGQAND